MRKRRFGSADVPVIGQGTWNMERDRAAAVAALRRGLDRGLTHVDTAEMYGSGAVEEVVAEAIAGRRDEVFLVTKVLPGNATRAGTRRALEASLRRLRTDHVDSYLLHWRGGVPLAETLEVLVALRDEGKTRSIGVSNFDADDVDEAVRLVGDGVIACNQVLYHLDERAIEHDVLPTCRRHGVAVVAYSPFGSGDFRDDHPALQRVARDAGATPRQVALAFLLRHDGVLAIPKAGRASHVDENARDVVLDDAAVAALDAAFPLGPRPSSLPMI